MMRRLTIFALIVLVLTAIAITLIALFGVRSSALPRIDEVIRRLDTRELWVDSQVPLGLELAGTAWGRDAPDGSVFGAVAINDGQRIVTLYMKNGKLFAANGINLTRRDKDSWWFCDVSLMKEYFEVVGVEGSHVP